MGQFTRRLAAVLAAMVVATALTVLPTSPAPEASASYTCGVHTHRGWVQIVNAGRVVYTITDIHIHYRNCTHRTQRKRPDISFAPDMSCQTVRHGNNRKWTYRDNSRDLSSYRSLKNC